MQNRVKRQQQSSQETPPVGRPKGATWRSLQADGIVWEGQVLLVGEDADLAARMIVTHRRVVFVRGGDVVLEIPRGWLRQEPVLRRDGILELFVATPESDPFDEPMRVPLRMREGHPAAGHIIAMLAPGGVRRIAPDSMSAFDRAREATPPTTYGGFWEGVERVSPSRDGSREDFGAGALERMNGQDAPADAREDLANLAPIEPPDRLVRSPSNPSQRPASNSYPITGMRPRNQRQTPWSLALRIAALVILLGSAALLGAGRLNLRLPGSGFDPFLAAPTPTVTASSNDGSTAPAEDTGTALGTEDLTAVAIGVGGPDDLTMEAGSSQDAIASATEPAASTDSDAAPEQTAIPTPASSAPEPDETATDGPATAQDSDAEAAAATSVSSSPAAVAQDAPNAAGGPSASELAVGPLRVAISTALRDESLPKYGLPPGTGEWVLLVAEIVNEGEAAESIAMSDIRLLDRGTGAVASLDSGTDVIAGLAGMKPAHGSADTIAVDPGESAEALLLYLVPDGSSDDLSLLVGDSSLDLAQPLATDPASDAETPQSVQTNESSHRNAQFTYLPRGWQSLWGSTAP